MRPAFIARRLLEIVLDLAAKGSVAVREPVTVSSPAIPMRAFGGDGACRHQPKETIMKLTDSQLVILSAAAKRESGALLPLPKSVKLNKGATTIVFKSLLKHKLVDERAAMPNETCWREAGDNRFVLVISETGLKALGIEKTDGANQVVTQEVEPRARGAKPEKPSAGKNGTPA